MTVPFNLQAIDHVVLRSTNAERLERFYVDVLGAQVVKRQPTVGLVHLAVGPSLIDLLTVEAADARPGPVDHVCLAVAPFDEAAIREHLTAHGIACEPAATRFGAGGSGPSIYLADPDGNRLELKGPAT